MRVVQVVNNGFEAGGAEKSVRILRDGLRDRGHDVRVVATDKLLPDDTSSFADCLVPAIGSSTLTRMRRYFWYQEAYEQIRGLVEQFRPDCVHLHTIGEFSPAVLAATRGYPRILTVHGPEDWTRSLLRWKLRSATELGALSAADRAMYLYLRFVQRPAYLPRIRRVDRIIAPSQYFAEAIRPDVGAVPVHVLPNGIEQLAFPQPVTSSRRLVYVGRLERVKGVHVLLDAYRRVHQTMPDALLAIVGDGRERPALESRARDLAATGTVRFLGWRTEAEVAKELAAASVVVLPSLWPENFPTVALEALQLGRPLVGSRVGGIPELVGPDNGVLVTPGDPAELAEALCRLLGDQELLESMSHASAQRAARYGVEEFLDAIVRHYEEVVSS